MKSAHTDIENLDYVDMLRGLAILAVLMVHCTQGLSAVGLQHLPLNLEYLMYAGKHGVALFFVVSSYTLMRSMNNRVNTEHHAIFKYFLRRFFRVAPAYYLVLLIVFFALGTGSIYYSNPAALKLFLTDLITHLLFINGFFPYYMNDFLGVEWSIPTEFTFYIVIPFIFMWLNKDTINLIPPKRIYWLCVVSILVLWLMVFKGKYLYVVIGDYPESIFKVWKSFFILGNLHTFLIGVVVWALVQNKKYSILNLANKPINKYKNKLKLIVVLVIIFLVAYVEAPHSVEISGRSTVSFKVWIAMIWGLLSAELVLILDEMRPKSIWLLSFLGRISFSLYLVHMPIYYALSQQNTMWRVTSVKEVNFLVYAVLAFSLSVLVALILHYCVELPGIRLGGNVIKHISSNQTI